MDFDISTLVYIVFAILYYLFFSGKKKSKQRRPGKPIEGKEEIQQTTREQRRPTFEELLKEFTGAKAFEEKIEPAPIPVPVVKEERKEEKKQLVRSVERTGHRSLDSAFERFEELDDHKFRAAILDDLKNPDSARKAFIYSEVFKRKY